MSLTDVLREMKTEALLVMFSFYRPGRSYRVALPHRDSG